MKSRKFAAKKHKQSQLKRENRKITLRTIFCSIFSLGLIVFGVWLSENAPLKVSAEVSQTEIEKAVYTRQEFFGASAIVPLPTAQARENLAKLAEEQTDNRQILEKLAELDEKTSDFDGAEKILMYSAQLDPKKLEKLAEFYERRAQFDRQAETVRRILATTEAEKRAEVFTRLIDLARKHDLRQYLQTEFYAQIVKENPDVYTVFEKLIDNLIEEKNYAEALNFVRQTKVQFPERREILLEKEVEILLDANNSKEAENVYQAAFDPFWTTKQAENFYNFLNRQDRLRAYGSEMKAKFKRNPADFDAAIRLALYQNHDYSYGNDEISPIILKLETAKKSWTTEELMTVSRLLMQANEAELASKFLYTLYLREDFKTNGEMRAKILYQLFEMFSDAEQQKLPLSKGDLRFYQDVAQMDTSPGIATGILSLIFSDTQPGEKLAEQETKANKYFNRAAAYKIFLAYKQEFPTSPELAQMYLDIIRLYAATEEPEIAAATLEEFGQRYQNSKEFAVVALKLADAYAAVNQPEKTREIYRQVLDYLGKQGKQLAPKKVTPPTDKSADEDENDQETDDSETEIAANSNDGINIPQPAKTPANDYYDDENLSLFHDYLGRKTVQPIYSEVLSQLVASLANEKKTPEILELYSFEIKKHPDEEWLYEQRLDWLEQTNLTDEKLEVYKSALARFKTRNWQDKLARWFVREKRDDEFAEFSNELVGKLNDEEIQDYLSQFVDQKMTAAFEKQLYLKLYESAHRRFPHQPSFVEGLLHYYKANKMETEWRNLAAEYYFESKIVRDEFLSDLAAKAELRGYLAKANGESEIYQLFRADAGARLSNFEDAVETYRKLDQIYPNTPEFSERLIVLTRSFGQKNRELLNESAKNANSQADFLPSSAEYRTRSGEIYAELGNYEKSRGEWQKLIATASGEKETYLDAATVNWDYFQYDEALRTIKTMRGKFTDQTLYSFETGAIYEAQHKQTEAVGEYVKALDADRDERQNEQAANRLKYIYNRENQGKNGGQQSLEMIDAAYRNESSQRRDASFLALGYARFLSEIKQLPQAEKVLNQAIEGSQNQEFIESARDFYQTAKDSAGEQIALKRLAAAATNPRQTIGYQLQLAESFEENKDRDSAKKILTQLVSRFPTNFGVINESANFLNRLGFEDQSSAVLQNALARSRGQFRTEIAQKLAENLVKSNRLDTAGKILADLHTENPENTEIFGQLSKIYVRQNDAANLRKAFKETTAALKASNAERREIDAQIADLRGQMIEAFTLFKDYSSAVEQHIEIINRDADDEELTENAIRYVQRYGGAETLLAYYQKTSAEAFKNYRWNVVLARIYDAQKDWENAAKNYSAAIVNQPEMAELYVALADIEVKQKDFDAAIKNLDEVLNLSNDAPEYVKKKIEILKKSGRLNQIEAEQAKLPVEEKSKVTTNEFAEAKDLKLTEKDKARELYRAGFAKLLENPLDGEMKAADLLSYVQLVRDEEPIDQINARFWDLRGKLIEKNFETDSTGAGEARKRISIVDNVLVEAVGGIAKNIATDQELAALHVDWQQRIKADDGRNLSLVQDLSRRAGFGDLEEIILRKKVESASPSTEKQWNLLNLVNFYNERGAYQKSFDALETFKNDDSTLTAAAARLVNNRESEMAALRLIYWKIDKMTVTPDGYVARYLEILEAENHDELKSLTDKSSAYQIQLINFLIAKGERELAHNAIAHTDLPKAWKVSRDAEISLALAEYGETAECYFCDALQFDTIGNLVNQNPDKGKFLINDDWFRLTREYGEWLDNNQQKTNVSGQFLVSMTENKPQSADEQLKIGEYYLHKKDLKPAIEHFRLAAQLEADDRRIWTNLGAAYYLADKKDWADQAWIKAYAAEDVESGLPFFKSLQKLGLAAEAREHLMPLTIHFLENNDAENSAEFENLIRTIAASFTNDEEKSAYFRRILKQRPTDVSLAAMLVNENLIAKNRQNEFYELLIDRCQKINNYDSDYQYQSVAAKVFTTEDAESVNDQENDYKSDEPQNERYQWQTKYLNVLIEQRDNAKAAQVIGELEKDLNKRFALSPQLRLAKIRLQIRAGKFDAAAVKRLIGITVSESATEIKLPNLERLGDMLQMLKEENLSVEKQQISQAFYARMIALGQFSAANLAGFSRTFYEQADAGNGLRILQLSVDLGDEAERETAIAELSEFEAVKAQTADAVKIAEAETPHEINQTDALKTAAEMSAEFLQIDPAIRFRRQLLQINPNDAVNRIELAKILVVQNEKTEAADLLDQIINDRESLRTTRWQARTILAEIGVKQELNEAAFDAQAQFYQGLVSKKTNQNELAANCFINSLIADKDAETSARQELIKVYASSGQFFAALKLAENDKTAKADELLEILSDAAQKIGDFSRALEFEKLKSAVNQPQTKKLQMLAEEKNRRKADLVIDLENTRQL